MRLELKVARVYGRLHTDKEQIYDQISPLFGDIERLGKDHK